jgi:nucleotide-binding universal stress UspA family protein
MESVTKYPDRVGRPFQTVVVGVDEHQGGRDATALAKKLLADDGSLIRARVAIRDSLVGRNRSPNIEPAESREGREPSADGAEELQGDDDMRWIVSSSVGRGLHELADVEHADLLVVGSCRRGLLGRVMIGDDTSDALNGVSCAIAIAPFGYAERPSVLREIGVAYNGSPESKDALQVARGLAAEHGARLSGFRAVSVPSYLAAPGVGPVLDSLPDLIEQARARIETLGDIEPHAAYGLPAEELALYSASLDLLVVGSRGYGPVGRLVHGSTSRQLARAARCPLLVLTRDACARLPTHLDHAARAATAIVG